MPEREMSHAPVSGIVRATGWILAAGLNSFPDVLPNVGGNRGRRRMAAFRTKLALDRTALAWIKTALAMASFGFGMVAFFRTLLLEAKTPEAVLGV
jgi:hypothetical protein